MATLPSNLLQLFRDPRCDLDKFVRALSGHHCPRVNFDDVLSIVAKLPSHATNKLLLRKVACLGFSCPLLRDAWIGDSLVTCLDQALYWSSSGSLSPNPYVLKCTKILIQQCSNSEQLSRALRMKADLPLVISTELFAQQLALSSHDEEANADVDVALLSVAVDSNRPLGDFIDELSTQGVALGYLGAFCKLLVHSSSTAATSLKIQFLAMACRSQRQYIIRFLAPYVACILNESNAGTAINLHHLEDILTVEYDVDLLFESLRGLRHVLAATDCPKHVIPMIDKVIRVLQVRINRVLSLKFDAVDATTLRRSTRVRRNPTWRPQEISTMLQHEDERQLRGEQDIEEAICVMDGECESDEHRHDDTAGDDSRDPEYADENEDDGEDDGDDNDEDVRLSYFTYVQAGKELQEDFYFRYIIPNRPKGSKRPYQSEDDDSDYVPTPSDSKAEDDSEYHSPSSDSDSEDSGSESLSPNTRSDSKRQGHKRRRYDRPVEVIQKDDAETNTGAQRAPTLFRMKHPMLRRRVSSLG